MMSTSSGSGRPQLVYASTDPVVVGLGRLLVTVGAFLVLALVVGMAIGWLVQSWPS